MLCDIIRANQAFNVRMSTAYMLRVLATKQIASAILPVIGGTSGADQAGGDRMIRIAISATAFDAIASMLPGEVGYGTR